MTETTATIYDIANELNRLRTYDETGRFGGHHDTDEGAWELLGLHTEDTDEPIAQIHPGDVQAAYKRLAAIQTRDSDGFDIHAAFHGLRVCWL